MLDRPGGVRRPPRKTKLDLRLTEADKGILKAAAEAEHKSLSEFVLESAMARAADRLADRTRFVLDAKAWAEFTKVLDAPPYEHPRMKRLLREPGVFDRRSEGE